MLNKLELHAKYIKTQFSNLLLAKPRLNRILIYFLYFNVNSKLEYPVSGLNSPLFNP